MAGWLSVGLGATASAQKLDNFARERGNLILKNLKGEIKKNYYDPNFHGLDIEERFKLAEEKIKTATSLGQIFGIIAQAVLDLNDSHTFFTPPPRTSRTIYGWQMQMVGDRCFVVAVQPGSDAEAKGLKPGDQVLAVNGFQPTRDNMWKMDYLFNALRPQPILQADVVSPGSNNARRLDDVAKVKQGKQVLDLAYGSIDWRDMIHQAENEERLHRHRYSELGEDLFIWKMPRFDFLEDGAENMMIIAARRALNERAAKQNRRSAFMPRRFFIAFRIRRVRLICMTTASLRNPPGHFVIYGVVVRD